MYAEEGGGVVGVVYKDAEFGVCLVGEVESAKWVGGKVVFNDIVESGKCNSVVQSRIPIRCSVINLPASPSPLFFLYYVIWKINPQLYFLLLRSYGQHKVSNI